MAIEEYTAPLPPNTPEITLKDIAWFAGIMEGEGSFLWNSSPVVTVAMTDEDIIQRVADIIGYEVSNYVPKRPNAKRVYETQAAGSRGAAWMMTLYPFMGMRRRGQITQVLLRWKKAPGFPRGRKGERLPALCHPKRLRLANGQCKQCYQREFQAKWRANPEHGTAATCHPEQRNHGYGLCSACYQRFFYAQRKNKPVTMAATCHPELQHYAQGLCKNCYQRQSYRARNSRNQLILLT
jgi:hypothetical protein